MSAQKARGADFESGTLMEKAKALVPILIPLIPGGALYRTMYSAVHQNWELCRFYGYQTLLTALGIAAGISFVSAILYILMNRAKQKALK